MSRRILPFVVITLVGVSSLGVAYAGSRMVRGPGFSHFRAMHGDRADPMAHGRAMLQDVLGELDATDEQSAVILAIADDTHSQLEGLHDGFEDHRARAHAVFTAEVVDRDALEGLRLEALDAFDQASQLIAGTVGDVGEVLSVEQRTELVALAEELHGE